VKIGVGEIAGGEMDSKIEDIEKRSQGLVVWEVVLTSCVCIVLLFVVVWLGFVVLVLCCRMLSKFVGRVFWLVLHSPQPARRVCWKGFSGWIRTPLNRTWVSRFAPKPRGF